MTIKELIKEIITLHKDDGYDNIERISQYVREKNTKLDTFQFTKAIRIPIQNLHQTTLENETITKFVTVEKKPVKLLSNFMEDIFYHIK